VDALFEASDLIGLMTAFIAIPRNDGSRSYGQGWGSREGQLRVDPGLLALNHSPFMAPKRRLVGCGEWVSVLRQPDTYRQVLTTVVTLVDALVPPS
jgi:hypothetical protein